MVHTQARAETIDAWMLASRGAMAAVAGMPTLASSKQGKVAVSATLDTFRASIRLCARARLRV
jgi:creatinine amidohydrolase/Fe(II)-dependent formamide hydrolase-like protein